MAGLFVFTRETLVIDNGLYYLSLPLLVWAAVRFGPLGIASALTVITCFAVSSFAGFSGYVISPSTPRDILSLQLFLCAAAVPLLLLAAQIEERKQTLEALRESEVRFRAAFESAATGMALVDPAGYLLQANQRLVEMLGYSEVELRAHTFTELTYPDDREPNLALLRQTLAGEIDSYQMEKRYLHKAGTIVWGRVSAGVVRDLAGRPLYLVSQLEDITSRKQLEQEREDARANELALRETKAQMDTFWASPATSSTPPSPRSSSVSSRPSVTCEGSLRSRISWRLEETLGCNLPWSNWAARHIRWSGWRRWSTTWSTSPASRPANWSCGRSK